MEEYVRSQKTIRAFPVSVLKDGRVNLHINEEKANEFSHFPVGNSSLLYSSQDKHVKWTLRNV